MQRVLFFGGEDADSAPLRAAAAHCIPPAEIRVLGREDPFAELSGDAPLLFLVDLDGDPNFALALARIVRRRHPACPIVAVYGVADDTARAALRDALADAAFERSLGPCALEALLERQLVKPRSGPASHPGSLGLADLDALAVLVRGLAHEVNNPLTTIRGFLQLLQSEVGRTSPEELREALATMESESRRIAEVVQELEYFGGARRPLRTPVDLASLVRDALTAAALAHVEPRGEVRGEVLLDREQVALALRHLLGWAASCATNGKPADIEVELERVHGAVVVHVATRLEVRGAAGGGPLLVPLHAVRNQGRERRSLACAFGIARAHGGSLAAERRDDRVEITLALPASTVA